MQGVKADGVRTVYTPAAWQARLITELRERRAADTKPAPTEQSALRDRFAGQAMGAVVSGCTWPAYDDQERWPALASTVADLAYVIADAMLAQRAKAKEPGT